MGYPSSVKAVICYIEAHITDEKFNYDELEKRIGFSKAYIRELFRKNTGCSLARYIRMRKVKCSAFELLNTDKSILEIAYQYGFLNPETYTRAFSKIVGMTPIKFRGIRPVVGKEQLCTGVYSIGILERKERRSDINSSLHSKEEWRIIMNENMYNDDESTVLYGVPRVEFEVCNGRLTPYPICLKACSEYLGEDVDYDFTMVSGGAAFRLVWNTLDWDMSNVDIFHTLEETNKIYEYGAKALGREFSFLGRDEGVTKEDFIAFIKEHIDEGYPCIALGIIGPPEPCVITGYRKNGEELLGWNFFQNDDEFKGSISFDETGYFICNNWWENTDTQAVMCMGPINGTRLKEDEIIANGVKILSGRTEYDYAKGIEAYDAWKKALLRDEDFSVSDNLFVLFEKLLCQTDAMNCLTDGRGNAAVYFKRLADEHKENGDKYNRIAGEFEKVKKTVKEMWSLLGDYSNVEGMLERLADRKVREETVRLIDVAKKADSAALEIMREVLG